MKLSDFDFDLPEELIATRPAVPRSASRLLVATHDTSDDRVFSELPDFLRPGDLLVLNDTKVIPARLFGVRRRVGAEGVTEARMEVTLLAPEADGQIWQAMIRPLKKIRDGETITFPAGLKAEVVDRADGTARVRINKAGDELDTALDQVGAMPLPPYIAAKRPADAQDKVDYQTVWAKNTGAVAAPTASLHFDDRVLRKLADHGVGFAHVTLHVGAGTFLPVKTDDISQHKMHSEWGQISQKAADQINAAKAAGGRIIPVGTTALRLIETAAREDGTVPSWVGDTDIFIAPGYRFKVTDALITNFHLPKSTLLMLVSALMGLDRMKAVYAHAVTHGYRFFSYGDASLLVPGSEKVT